MRKKIILSIITILVLLPVFGKLSAQESITGNSSSSFPVALRDSSGNIKEYLYKMTLEDVISTARDQSPSAQVARHSFLADYWRYRTYKAQLLPSLSLTSSLGSYNRSLVALQNAETGETNYIVNDNLNNSLSLSLKQNIPLTGGSLSLSTSLNRLDQFSPYDKIVYNSTPVHVSYSQPIKAYNSLKWDKIIEPKKYEIAKRGYLETLEDISISAGNLFFDVLTKQKNLDMAQKNYSSIEMLYNIAQERYKIGTISNEELLQLKLRLYNSKLSISDCSRSFNMAMLNLRSYLGFNENTKIELVMSEQIPEIQLDFSDVFEKVNKNSSFTLEKELTMINAEQVIAQAKSTSGLQASLFAQFGFNQKGETFPDSYKNPMDQEILGLSLTLPILDWGLGKGKVKLAKSQREVVKTQVEQAYQEYRQDILLKVFQFNQQREQCNISAQADSIASLRYEVTKQKFQNGTVSVTDLNNAQSEKDEAALQYVSNLSKYWQYYLNIRKLSLYDYLEGKEISADFDKITRD
jgi:outer membrane protein TolC